MGMEGGGSVEQGRAHYHNKVNFPGHNHHNHVGYMKNRVIRKKKCCSKNRKMNYSSSDSALQHLFVSCKEVFQGLGNGTPPLPQHVNNLRSILDTIKPEDIGLSNDLQFFNPKSKGKGGTTRVTYTTIYKCSTFSLCCFFIPANGVIPLHNHPGMTVFSKLLLGKMHIKSYDLVSTNAAITSDGLEMRLAKVKADHVFSSPCNASVLYPTTGGNIHAFTAVTPCAVLDVLGPPYSKQDGRDCSYYKDHPFEAYSNAAMAREREEGECYGWLQEIEVPCNSEMDGIEYLGPQIIDTM